MSAAMANVIDFFTSLSSRGHCYYDNYDSHSGYKQDHMPAHSYKYRITRVQFPPIRIIGSSEA